MKYCSIKKKFIFLIKTVSGIIFFKLLPLLRGRKISGSYGLNFIGYAREYLGQGETMRSLVNAAHSSGTPLIVRDFDPGLKHSNANRSLEAFMKNRCEYLVNCLCINPDMLYRLPYWVAPDEWLDKYNVGYWFWELPNFPEQWEYALTVVDEIWVSTDFIMEIMAKTGKTVRKIPFYIEFENVESNFTRSKHGIPDKDYVFLFHFDYFSTIARKNPHAVINAFLDAFPSSINDVCLVIKSINGTSCSKVQSDLVRQACGDTRIIFIDETLNSDDMRCLIDCCDSYVSLHRSEGLGLGMAEAMYLSKPVIATGYSGNTEFMNASNSLLVPYELVELKDNEYYFGAGQYWASPNLNAASNYMRKLYFDRTFSDNLGREAGLYMRKHHSKDVTANAIRDSLSIVYTTCCN